MNHGCILILPHFLYFLQDNLPKVYRIVSLEQPKVDNLTENPKMGTR